jgi:hypothetical protein
MARIVHRFRWRKVSRLLFEFVKSRTKSIFAAMFTAKVMLADDVKAAQTDHHSSSRGKQGDASAQTPPHPYVSSKTLTEAG